VQLGGFEWLVILAVAAAIVALRWFRPGMLTWVVASLAAVWAVLEWGFVTPIPASVKTLYLGIAAAGLFAYVASSKDRFRQTMRPVLRLVLEPRLRLLLAAIVVALPAAAAFQAWRASNVPLRAPSFGRTVHPAPPETITVHDEEINLLRVSNPYRKLKDGDPAGFAAHLDNGRRIYYENCFYCHGDAMAGDGMFAHGLNPIPTNFTDKGTLPNLTESFVFWRIAKGGPGLPEEGGPWDSAMPRWEQFLTTEEMWDVVLFLYEFNGLAPRALEEHHE
jgi:mono/diheme cytochrome c family protein